MKRKYIAGLLLAMMVVGVGCTINEPSDIVTENPGVETPVEEEAEQPELETESGLVFIDDTKIKDGVMNFTVRNDGEGTLTYGRPYIVEVKDETGGWALTELTNELAFTADIVAVLPGETMEESIDLNMIKENLDKEKEYRAVVNYSLEGSDNFFQARFYFNGELENESASASVMETEVDKPEGEDALPEEEIAPEETANDESEEQKTVTEPEEESENEESEEGSEN